MPAPREPGDDQLPPALDGTAPALTPADEVLIPAVSFSAALTVRNASLQAGLRTGTWVTALADGHLPDKALARWRRQRLYLAVHQVPTLQALRALSPPATVAEQLYELQQDVARQGRQLDGLRDALEPPDDKTAVISKGYWSYLRTCAAESLPAGLTALYTAAWAERHIWTGLPPEVTAGRPLHAWHTARISSAAGELLTDLAAILDEFAAPGSPWQQHRLERIHQTVLCWENAWWHMCWHGTGWLGITWPEQEEVTGE
jgi:thiaminase